MGEYFFCGGIEIMENVDFLETHTHTCERRRTHMHTHIQTNIHTHTCTYKHTHTTKHKNKDTQTMSSKSDLFLAERFFLSLSWNNTDCRNSEVIFAKLSPSQTWERDSMFFRQPYFEGEIWFIIHFLLWFLRRTYSHVWPQQKYIILMKQAGWAELHFWFKGQRA